MNIKGSIIFMILCTIGLLLNAQTSSLSMKCGAIDLEITTHNKRLDYYSKLKNLSFQSELRHEEIVTIPVVFHIFRHAGVDEFTTDEIDLLLDRTNKLLLYKSNEAEQPQYAHLRAVPSFQLCLTSLDPDGEKTTGINHYERTSLNYADQFTPDGKRMIFYETHGGVDPWDSEKFLNIYVATTDQIVGWARNPLISDKVAEDAILISLNPLSDDFEAYTPRFHHVITHELGHYFGLSHIWGKPQDCEVDDGISDTPLQENPTFTCISSNTCGSADMTANFMNYTVMNCSDMFTIEQVSVMKKVLNQYRPQLAQEDLCVSLTPDNVEYIISQYGQSITITKTTQENLDLQLYIYDLLGRLVYMKKYNGELVAQVDRTIPTAGLFLFVLKDKNGTQVKKVFLSH